MKETFGLWTGACDNRILYMWISITASGFECSLNQFLPRCSYAAAVLRWHLSVRPSVCLPNVCIVTKRNHIRHSDVASTHQYVAQNFNRRARIALPRFCNLHVKFCSGMLGSHRLGAIIEVQRPAPKLQRAWRAGPVYF